MGKRFKWQTINPDGVPVRICVRAFLPGTSIFIPCINLEHAFEQVVEIVPDEQLVWKAAVNKGRLGIRVWNIKH
jgi:hypothetical protein